MSHYTNIKVRGYHLDGYGHVNNARYLEFLEEARWSIFEERLDLPTFMARGILFVVVNINIDYRSPARQNETLVIETALVELKSHSGILRQVMRRMGENTVVTDARITFVILDGQSQRPIKLEGEVADLIQNLA